MIMLLGLTARFALSQCLQGADSTCGADPLAPERQKALFLPALCAGVPWWHILGAQCHPLIKVVEGRPSLKAKIVLENTDFIGHLMSVFH